MADGRGTGLGVLIAAKFVCCGGLVLLATGALSGLGIWLADRWYVWVGGAIAIVSALVLNIPRHLRVDVQDRETSKCHAGVTRAPVASQAQYDVTFSPADGRCPRRVGRD